MFDDTPRPPIVPPVSEAGDSSPVSEAEARFASCRWQEPASNGTAAHCTNREVLAFAGTGGFSPDAWCLDCRHFKLRRTRRRQLLSDQRSGFGPRSPAEGDSR